MPFIAVLTGNASVTNAITNRVLEIVSITGVVYKLQTIDGVVEVDVKTQLPTIEALELLVEHKIYTTGLGSLWSAIWAYFNMSVEVTYFLKGEEVKTTHILREASAVADGENPNYAFYVNECKLLVPLAQFCRYPDVRHFAVNIMLKGPIDLASDLLEFREIYKLV